MRPIIGRMCEKSAKMGYNFILMARYQEIFKTSAIFATHTSSGNEVCAATPAHLLDGDAEIHTRVS
jgi:hypothetical protein